MRGTIAGGAGMPIMSITPIIITGVMGTTIITTIGTLTPITRDTNASYLGPSDAPVLQAARRASRLREEGRSRAFVLLQPSIPEAPCHRLPVAGFHCQSIRAGAARAMDRSRQGLWHPGHRQFCGDDIHAVHNPVIEPWSNGQTDHSYHFADDPDC